MAVKETEVTYKDSNVGDNGRYNEDRYGGHSTTDTANMSSSDLDKIAEIRNSSMSGQEKNDAANAIRSNYGYSIDQAGNVTTTAYRDDGSGGGGGGGGSRRTSSGGGGGGYANNTNVNAPQVPDLAGLLDKWRTAAETQQTAQIDYNVNRGVEELQRAEADAQQGFTTQQNQITADELQARDAKALYNQAQGDRGGIGSAQLDSISNTAATNRQTVMSEQQKLSTDIARQISDLRAQGEFQKADALLQIGQQYLSQLIGLEQWAFNANMSVAQFTEGVREFDMDYEAKIAQLLGSYQGQDTLAKKEMDASLTGYYNGAPTLQKQQVDANYTGYYNGQQTLDMQKLQAELEAASKSDVSTAGWKLLSAGVSSSLTDAQLTAMGLTREQANAYATAVQAAANKSKSSSSSSKTGTPGTPKAADTGDETSDSYDKLFAEASKDPNPPNYIKQNYKKFGFSAQGDLVKAYDAWVKNGSGSPSLDYQEDEGVITYNGKTFSSYNDFIKYVKQSGLTAGQKSALQKKIALLFGGTEDFS